MSDRQALVVKYLMITTFILQFLTVMDNKMRVKNNDGVPTLLATLRKFPDHAEVVLSALKTLGNLVDLGKNISIFCLLKSG